MKTIQKKLRKERSTTLHMTTLEDKYLRIRKRQTGLSLSDVVREEYLTPTAELYFKERPKTSRKDQATAPAVQ